VYAGQAAWIDTEEGQFWKTTRDVGIDPKKLHLVVTVQVKTIMRLLHVGKAVVAARL
jgi:hypothetical protein